VRILIVDDEPNARERLALLVEEIDAGHEIVGAATDGETAVERCRSRDVDLVLLDIEMPGMGGLEAAAHLAALDPPPAVVMVTAYPEYALGAFEHQADDYLVKPVRRERLLAALQRVATPSRPQREALISRPDPLHRRHQLTAPYRGGLQAVPVEDVLYLQAEQKYVTVRHTEGRLLIDESLKALEEEFADLFLRIHRSALVARRHLAGIEKDCDGTCLAHLRGCDERLPVSRRHLADVKRWLKGGSF
jgi:two-component system response regulator AlgR